MQGMFSYPKAAAERAMRVQEVILRAMAKKITWWQIAEIIGITDRQMRRWHCVAVSLQARRRSERGFGTWQGRLPQELRLRGISTLRGSERFSRGGIRGRVQSAFSSRRHAAGKSLCALPEKGSLRGVLDAATASGEPE